jgi:hypothetical protein
MGRKLPLIAFIALLSVMIVFALSWSLPVNSRQTDTVQRNVIDESNLSDLLAGIPLQSKIRHVELNHSILSIDLTLPGKIQSEAVFSDLYRIAQHAIGATSNLNEVLVRVFDTSWGAPGVSTRAALLLSSDLTRKGMRSLTTINYDKNPNFYRMAMERNFQIAYTPRWSERFAEP